MQIDQSRRRELGGMIGKGSGKGALVVIVAVSGWGVFTANVDNGVTCREKGRITGPEE